MGGGRVEAEFLPWSAVDRLKGIGPKLGSALVELGVARVIDLLLHLPHRYEDRTQRLALDAPFAADQWVLVRGRVTSIRSRRAARRRMRIVTGALEDGRGVLPVVWFNQPWVEQRLSHGEWSLYGPVRAMRDGRLQLVNPDLSELEEDGEERIVPVYPALGPLSGRRLRRLVGQCLEVVDRCPDPLPEPLRRELGVPELAPALRELHQPGVPPDQDQRRRLVESLNRRQTPAHLRLALDELLAFCCGLAEHRLRRQRLSAPTVRIDGPLEEWARRLAPFELTRAQLRVVEEIARDLDQPAPMARLVQGEVGSGKTVVAALAALAVLEGGHQAALMAPTELLAEQHARTLERMFAKLPFAVHLLTSSSPLTELRRVRESLADGAPALAVGTHALIQRSVEFRDLALAVVDEQHRFGVAHRQALVAKGRAPHLLVMTATPIPRSLALTVYGDLELSIIDELPPGRSPVRTVIRRDAARPRLFAFLRRELAAGGRAYLVYPMIEASDEVAAPALEEQVAVVRSLLPGCAVGVLHGRMPRAEREQVSRAFATGELQALLATTVVEVGIDVPEASVMVIEGADRFGLCQLHQLRGRVGRGGRRGWCVLLTDDHVAEEARHRLEALCRSSDGFEIAETDLALRGAGDLTGTRQWGPGSFRFADLGRHRELVATAHRVARRLAESGGLPDVRSALARYHRVDVDLPAG